MAARLAKGHVGVPTASTEEPIAVRLLAHLQHLREPVGKQHSFVAMVHEERAQMRRELP